jgi:hypothetical protein
MGDKDHVPFNWRRASLSGAYLSLVSPAACVVKTPWFPEFLITQDKTRTGWFRDKRTLCVLAPLPGVTVSAPVCWRVVIKYCRHKYNV